MLAAHCLRNLVLMVFFAPSVEKKKTKETYIVEKWTGYLCLQRMSQLKKLLKFQDTKDNGNKKVILWERCF